MAIKQHISTFTCLGGGIIGSGWAALALANNKQVKLWDPSQKALNRAKDHIQTALVSLGTNGYDVANVFQNLELCDTLEAALSNSDFVQESAPEILGLKQDLFSQIDALVPDSVIIASSSSAITMTQIAMKTRHPKRCIIAHPLNPVYLVPVVELVPGEQTSQQTVSMAKNIYEQLGKKPITLNTEKTGFVLNRLQETLWREAFRLVANNQVSVEDVETALTSGLGLRWSILGPFMVYHLAYGEKGIADFFAEHNGAHKGWADLDPPKYSAKKASEITQACESLGNGKTELELMRERDMALVSVLNALNLKD
ncbi:MAG: 3-hydroxyacyl-CoA dehydrogenase NAD-binding domain-containing protein [Pseudomonadota bacterium]